MEYFKIIERTNNILDSLFMILCAIFAFLSVTTKILWIALIAVTIFVCWVIISIALQIVWKKMSNMYSEANTSNKKSNILYYKRS